jgi:hypothetical protein
MSVIWRMALVAVIATTHRPSCAVSSSATIFNKGEAYRSTGDKAAAIVDAKGKAALSDFREKSSEWFSGELYVFTYAPDGTVVLNPAFLLVRAARQSRVSCRLPARGLPARRVVACGTAVAHDFVVDRHFLAPGASGFR